MSLPYIQIIVQLVTQKKDKLRLLFVFLMVIVTYVTRYSKMISI